MSGSGDGSVLSIGKKNLNGFRAWKYEQNKPELNQSIEVNDDDDLDQSNETDIFYENANHEFILKVEKEATNHLKNWTIKKEILGLPNLLKNHAVVHSFP